MLHLQEFKTRLLFDLKNRATKIGYLAGILVLALLTLSICCYAGVASWKWFIIFLLILGVGFILFLLMYFIRPYVNKWRRRAVRCRLARIEMEQVKQQVLRANPHETRLLRSLLNIDTLPEGDHSPKHSPILRQIDPFAYQPQRTWISEPNIFRAEPAFAEMPLDESGSQPSSQDSVRNTWYANYESYAQTMVSKRISRQLRHIAKQMTKSSSIQFGIATENSRCTRNIVKSPPRSTILKTDV